MRLRMTAATAVLMLTQTACATLGSFGQLVQPVRFEQADGRNAEIRLVGPRSGQPLGGAAVRIWTRVRNPNPFGLTLNTLRATLIIEDTRAADGDFPLGLPLRSGEDSVVPLDLSISFSDLPGLGGSLRQLAVGGTVGYQLDGTVGIDAGRLGTPTFGPMLLTSGELRAVR